MKLHIGCGKKFIPGFIHVDLQNFDHIDYKVTADKLEFANDNSVKLIYASHVLEHYGRNEYMRVLSEWYRVLHPGGKLRLSVPDFEAVVNYYKLDPDLSKVLGLLIGGQKKDQYDFHKMIFDRKLLTDSLYRVGFKDVFLYDWRETDHANIDDYSQAYLPHMDKDSGMLMSLNLEAIK